MNVTRYLVSNHIATETMEQRNRQLGVPGGLEASTMITEQR